MRAQSPHFSVSYGTADDGHGGAAVVVSKKVDTSSVKRHIVKRRVREALREFARQDQVLIVYVRPGSVSLTFQEIQAELGELIRRSGA
jgi:ribonuclease P protein component